MNRPWSYSQLQAELDYPLGVQLLATAAGGRVCGYALFRYVAQEAELLRIGVAQDDRRTGVGRALWERGLCCLRATGVMRCFAEVRRSNTVARSFYERLGCVRVGSRKKYYLHPVEDAIVVQRTID